MPLLAIGVSRNAISAKRGTPIGASWNSHQSNSLYALAGRVSILLVGVHQPTAERCGSNAWNGVAKTAQLSLSSSIAKNIRITTVIQNQPTWVGNGYPRG